MTENLARREMASGERNGSARLAESDIREIRRLHAEGATQVSLAKIYGVAKGNISFIVNRQTWRHVA